MEQKIRKRLRLQGFDYSGSCVCFITVCTEGRKPILCSIREAPREDALPILTLTEIGKTVETYLRQIPGIDQYVIMPNHIHLILFCDGERNVSTMMRSFKTLVTKECGRSIWQRSFYDHVIRDEADYQTKWSYIESNPSKWAMDEYYQR